MAVINKRLEKICQEVNQRLSAQLDSEHIDIAPHDYRRTYTTTLLEAGLPLRAIQKLLGHSTIAQLPRPICSMPPPVTGMMPRRFLIKPLRLHLKSEPMKSACTPKLRHNRSTAATLKQALYHNVTSTKWPR